MCVQTMKVVFRNACSLAELALQRARLYFTFMDGVNNMAVKTHGEKGAQ
jgi:hypothetical protein